MGNCLCARSHGKAQIHPFKVVRPDGTIEVFRRSVTTWELIKQHPNHSVFHSSAMLLSLTPTSALPLNKELEGGRLYYILPANTFNFHQTGQLASPPEGLFEGPSRSVIRGFPQMTVGQADLQTNAPEWQGKSWKPRLETINEVRDSS